MEVVKGSNKKGGKDKPDKGKGDEIDLTVYIIDINGTKMPTYAIKTIREADEYDYNIGGLVYYIVINEQLEGVAMGVYSNVRIKCSSILHRQTLVDTVKDRLVSSNSKIEFI